MNKTNVLLAKIVVFLFALNSVSLCLYQFTFKNSSPSPNHNLNYPNRRNRSGANLKPWPILPSYLPWSHHSPPAPRSCEAFFGNGFSRRLDPLPPTNPDEHPRGWFRCWHSETLQSSICEGGSVRMVPERIKVSRGGEGLGEVIGRGEEEELPEFKNGAFEVDGGVGFLGPPRGLVDGEFLDRYVPEGQIVKHTMRDLIRSVQVVGPGEFQCHEVWGFSQCFFFCLLAFGI
jgi:glycoprotein 2-beta-D-xylosyltransferase